jgi:hypothetical protein
MFIDESGHWPQQVSLLSEDVLSMGIGSCCAWGLTSVFSAIVVLAIVVSAIVVSAIMVSAIVGRRVVWFLLGGTVV